MAVGTGNEVDVILAVGRQVSRVQFGNIRVFGVDGRVALGTGLLRIQAHLCAGCKVALGAIQAFMHGTFQVAAIVSAGLVAFFAQFSRVLYGHVGHFGRVEESQPILCSAGWVVAGGAGDRLPVFGIALDDFPGTFLIHRLDEIADFILASLERRVAGDALVDQQFGLVVFLIRQHSSRARRMQRQRPAFVLFSVACAAV